MNENEVKAHKKVSYCNTALLPDSRMCAGHLKLRNLWLIKLHLNRRYHWDEEMLLMVLFLTWELLFNFSCRLCPFTSRCQQQLEWLQWPGCCCSLLHTHACWFHQWMLHQRSYRWCFVFTPISASPRSRGPLSFCDALSRLGFPCVSPAG